MQLFEVISENLQTIISYFRHFGFHKTAVRVLTDSLKHVGVLRISRFIVLYPEYIESSAFTSELSYERGLLPAAAMRQYHAQLADQLPAPFLLAAEQRGDYCYAIFNHELLVSFGWYAIESARLFDRFFTFGPEFVYMYHGFTRPEYRGKRLHALGLAEALTAFQQKRKSAIVSTVNITNYRARRSAERLGFRCFGYIVQFGPSWLSLLYVTARARAYGIRLRR